MHLGPVWFLPLVGHLPVAKPFWLTWLGVRHGQKKIWRCPCRVDRKSRQLLSELLAMIWLGCRGEEMRMCQLVIWVHEWRVWFHTQTAFLGRWFRSPGGWDCYLAGDLFARSQTKHALNMLSFGLLCFKCNIC